MAFSYTLFMGFFSGVMHYIYCPIVLGHLGLMIILTFRSLEEIIHCMLLMLLWHHALGANIC